MDTNTTSTKKLNKKIIIGAVAAIILFVIIIAATTGPKKVNLEECVKVTYDGCNGYATANVQLDRSKIKELAEFESDDDIDDFSDLGDAINEELLFDEAIDSIQLKITSKKQKLSNGDKITVSISYDNTVAKKADIKFKGKSVSVKVKNLPTVEEVNPFADMEVVFSGVSPNGIVEWNYTGDKLIYTGNFSVDKTSGLRNGDVITLTYKGDDEDCIAEGFIVAKREEQYTVSGLEEYVGKYADIDAEFMKTLKSDAEDSIQATMASNYSGMSVLEDLQYEGYIYSVAKKNENRSRDFNILYYIYSTTVATQGNQPKELKWYFPVKVSDIKQAEENFTLGDTQSIVGSTGIPGTWSSMKGYNNPYTCYKDLVDATKSDYEVVCGDGFEAYEKQEEIKSLSDISDKYKKELQNEAKDFIESRIATDYDATSKVTELKLAGEYFLSAKTQGANTEENNKYIVVYAATVSSEKSYFEAATVYFPVEYDGIVKLQNDEYLKTNTVGIIGGESFPNSSFATFGYITGETMYKEIVTANRGKYKYEVSEGLKKFGD